MSDRDIITIEPDKRGGKPCIRRMRITVYDVLGWLASGMSMTAFSALGMSIKKMIAKLTHHLKTANQRTAGRAQH